MKDHWTENDKTAALDAAGTAPEDRALALRIYTSRLLGQEPDLVLHGGGNTSVKVTRCWPDGKTRKTLHVKGSGWDLATIEAPGLPAVDLEAILAVRTTKNMSDPDMVALLRASLMEAEAPNPSVETLLHAFIPHAFVDHTHSLPILALANQPNAEQLCAQVFGGKVAFVPYVMPGFDLSIAAADIYDQNPNCKGLFLRNHGLFTFSDDARDSYDLTIEYTTRAEDYLASRGAAISDDLPNEGCVDPELTSRLSQAFSDVFTDAPAVSFDYREDDNTRRYASHSDLVALSRRGTVTPDHVIRTKPFPMICKPDSTVADLIKILKDFAERYTAYFNRNAPNAAEGKTMLAPSPKSIIVEGCGVYGVGNSAKDAGVVADLLVQTTRAVAAAETLGRFEPLCESDLFDMEYWSLEQAKLAK